MMRALSLLAVPVIGLAVTIMMVQFNLGTALSVRRWVLLLIGVLFIAVGNYLPKTPVNAFTAIAFPGQVGRRKCGQRRSGLAGI